MDNTLVAAIHESGRSVRFLVQSWERLAVGVGNCLEKWTARHDGRRTVRSGSKMGKSAYGLCLQFEQVRYSGVDQVEHGLELLSGLAIGITNHRKFWKKQRAEQDHWTSLL